MPRSELPLDHSGVESSGRAATAALPAPRDHVRSVSADRRPARNGLVCDVCGSARSRDDRRRLVWEADPANRLVLAELCRDCAAFADPLLDLYGGRGREAIRLVQEFRAGPPERTAQPRPFGYAIRGALYLLIGIASFFLVTLVTSLGR